MHRQGTMVASVASSEEISGIGYGIQDTREDIS
jgi:hypothetical protein